MIFTGFSLGGFYGTPFLCFLFVSFCVILCPHLCSCLCVAAALSVLEGPPAVVLAAPGTEDFMTEAYSYLFHDYQQSHWNYTSERFQKVFNFFHTRDTTPRLDCQVGFVCEWMRTPDGLHHPPLSSSTDVSDQAHLGWVFGHKYTLDGSLRQPTTSAANAAAAATRPVPEQLSLWDKGAEASEYERASWTPVCRPGSDYSREYGSCARETKRWRERMVEQEAARQRLLKDAGRA